MRKHRIAIWLVGVVVLGGAWLAYSHTRPFHPHYKNYEKTLEPPAHAQGS